VAAAVALQRLAGGDPLIWLAVVRVGRFERPFATLGNPLHFGAYLAMAVPVSLHFARMAQRRGLRAAAAVLALQAVLSGVLVAASLSRGAWAAALAAAVVVGWGSWRGEATGRPSRMPHLGARAAGVAVVVALALLLVPAARDEVLRGVRAAGDFLATYSPSGQASVSGRRLMWRAAWEMFLARPWLGYGLDAFQMAFQLHRPLDLWRLEWGVTPIKAHNDVLQVMATQGLLGIAALVVVLGGLMRNARRALGQVEAGDGRALVRAVLAWWWPSACRTCRRSPSLPRPPWP